MSTGLLSRVPFADHVNSQLGEMVPIEGSVNWQWGPHITTIVSTHLFMPCSGILAHCGYMTLCVCHNHYYSVICVILLLCFSC